MHISFQTIHTSNKFDDIIFDALKSSYENLYIEKEDEELLQLLELKYAYSLNESQFITGFNIIIDVVSPEDFDVFIDSFTNTIQDCDKVIAFIKLHDETRFRSYLKFYKTIASIEMQLREILTYIFYYEYSEDFYDLLHEYNVRFPKDTPDGSTLRERLENQFFYLSFSDYLRLEKPKKIQNIKDINSKLENSDSFEEFKQKVCDRGIKNEKHLDFLAAIKRDMKTMTIIRNAVAHNRTISTNKLAHFDTAKDHLLEHFKNFWIDIDSEETDDTYEWLI